MACDGKFVGTLGYNDPLRPESVRLVNLLQRQFGLDLHLLTGDNPQRAAQVAQELGIAAERVYSDAFPDQKAKIVRDLHRAGRTVAFVGGWAKRFCRPRLMRMCRSPLSEEPTSPAKLPMWC